MGSVELYLVKVSEGKDIERKRVLIGSVSVVEAGMKAAEAAAREAAKRAAKGG